MGVVTLVPHGSGTGVAADWVAVVGVDALVAGELAVGVAVGVEIGVGVAVAAVSTIAVGVEMGSTLRTGLSLVVLCPHPPRSTTVNTPTSPSLINNSDPFQ